MRRHWYLIVFSLIAVSVAPIIAQQAAPSQTTSQEEDIQRQPTARVQREVMDFSDAYASAVRDAIDDYVKNEPDSAKRVDAQAWKVLFTSSAMMIAAAPDPRANLLDMVVFISVGKWAVNNYWVPKVFGKKAGKLRDVYGAMDRDIWAQAARVLTPGQQRNLRELIAAWERSNPQMYEVSDVRLRNLEGFRAGEFDTDASAKGILASLRKVLGRVDTSLLYGERMMFYMERAPRILSQQTDLTLAQITQDFPLATLHPDLDRLTTLAEKLPAQIQEGIDKNQVVARELLPELHATLDSADRFSKNLNDIVQSLSSFSKNADGTPLRPEDYTALLKQANGTLSQLDLVIRDLNVLVAEDEANPAKAAKLGRIFDERTDHLLQAVWHRALFLLMVFFVGVALLLILTRILFFPRKRDD